MAYSAADRYLDEVILGTRYVVLNENTLGYFHDGVKHGSKWMGVLRADVFKGQNNDPLRGPVFISCTDEIRPATPDDFKQYRVMLPPSLRP